MARDEFMERTVDPTAFSRQVAEQEPRSATLPGMSTMSTSAEIQIVGARKVEVERDEKKIIAKMKTLALMAGENYYYRFPVTSRDGKKDYIEGPSIKLANDLARTYGNCHVDVRAFDLGDSWMFYARFLDIETGFAMTRAFQQRKGQTSLKTKDQGRQLDIAFQIGQSKAIRNVVVNALQTHADFAFEEAKANMVEKIGKNLPQMREKVKLRLGEMKVDLKRVEGMVGRALDKWLASDMARVIAEIQAVQDGMADAEDTWPSGSRPTRAEAASQVQEEQQAELETEARGPAPEGEPGPEAPAEEERQPEPEPERQPEPPTPAEPQPPAEKAPAAAPAAQPAAKSTASATPAKAEAEPAAPEPPQAAAPQGPPVMPPAPKSLSKKEADQWWKWVVYQASKIREMPQRDIAPYLQGSLSKQFDWIGKEWPEAWGLIEAAIDTARAREP